MTNSAKLLLLDLILSNKQQIKVLEHQNKEFHGILDDEEESECGLKLLLHSDS